MMLGGCGWELFIQFLQKFYALKQNILDSVQIIQFMIE